MVEAAEWVKKMAEKGAPPNLQTYNTLIDGYGRSCQCESCFLILEEMENNGLKPNVVSYGFLVNCLCKDGRLLEVK